MKIEAIVYRKNGPPWVFDQRADLDVCDSKFGAPIPAFICNQRKHTYRLFLDFNDPYKPVWIGRLFQRQEYSPQRIVDGYGWYTCEAELGVTHIEVGNVRIFFLQDSRY